MLVVCYIHLSPVVDNLPCCGKETVRNIKLPRICQFDELISMEFSMCTILVMFSSFFFSFRKMMMMLMSLKRMMMMLMTLMRMTMMMITTKQGPAALLQRVRYIACEHGRGLNYSNDSHKYLRQKYVINASVKFIS